MIPLKLRLINFIDTVTFVADKEFQHKIWVQKIKGLTSVDSMGELYCQCFDDNAIDQFIDEELSTSPLNEMQKKAILDFRDALNAYYEIVFRYKIVWHRVWWKRRLMLIKPESELINEPEWNKLVQLAISIKKLFPDVMPEYDFSRER
jgi:hypothetical protein